MSISSDKLYIAIRSSLKPLKADIEDIDKHVKAIMTQLDSIEGRVKNLSSQLTNIETAVKEKAKVK